MTQITKLQNTAQRGCRATARLVLATLAALGLAAALPHVASAQADGSSDYTFKTFSLPDATQTYILGINNWGQITGFYVDTVGAYHGYTLNAHVLHGTVSQPTAFSTFNIGQKNTVLGAINSFGQTLGGITDSSGVTDLFELTGRGRVSLRPADAYNSILFQNGFVYDGGLNDFGLYDSTFGDANGLTHGFVGFVDLFGHPHTKTVDYPSASAPRGTTVLTELFGNNDWGQIVGAYRASTPQRHDFLYDARTGRFTDLKISSANPNYSFLPYDINNERTIAGRYVYYDGVNGYYPFGFVQTLSQQRTGQYTAVNPPNALAAIIAGVDDFGDLVGFYELNNDPTYTIYAFLAIPHT